MSPQSIKKKGVLFIVSAPSGAGKTTLLKALFKADAKLKVSVSYTTRPPRANEVDGIDYHFVNADKFNDMVKQEKFLEHATIFSHLYGTSLKAVEDMLEANHDVILEIDWQGANLVRSKMKNTVGIFVLPPSIEQLLERITHRNDNTINITQRYQEAKDDISHYTEYDFIVINDDFDRSLGELKAIIKATTVNQKYQTAFYDSIVKELVEKEPKIN